MNSCRFPQGSAGGRSMTVSKNDDRPGFDSNIPKRFVTRIILKKFPQLHSSLSLNCKNILCKSIKDSLVQKIHKISIQKLTFGFFLNFSYYVYTLLRRKSHQTSLNPFRSQTTFQSLFIYIFSRINIEMYMNMNMSFFLKNF